MKRILLIGAGLILAAAILAPGPAPAASAEEVLVRLDRATLALVPPDLRGGLTAAAELADGWLSVMPRATSARLAEAGARAVVLESEPGRKAFFFVRVRRVEDWPLLERKGRVERLDDGTALFWSGDREAREILPPDLEISRLFLDEARPIADREEAAVSVPTAPAAADPQIAAWAAQVARSRLTTTISDLEGFRTRYASTAACELAGDYLYRALTGLGLRTEYDPFTFGNGRYASRNIVATLPGRTLPEREVIVSAHYDSTSNQSASLAPGADDNGSGTAGVLEIARILSGAAFDFTVRFVCFSAEEWGLYGSKHYVDEARATGANIVGVINMDMIGYPEAGAWRVDAVRNSASADLAARLSEAASLYAVGLTVRAAPFQSWPYSDQSPFWGAGYAALTAIEQEEPISPYYHKTSDTIGTLTLDYTVQIVRAALAATAGLARPVSTPVSPTGLVVRRQISRSLYLKAKTVGLRWNANRDAVVGYHVYRATVRGGPYERLTGEPQAATDYTDRFLDANILYYYVVTAVDASGRESRASVEVADSEATWN